MSRYFERVLISERPASCCEEVHQWFLRCDRDGNITREYEGCGGYMRSASRGSGEKVERERAIGTLNECIQDLRWEMEELEERLTNAQELLKHLSEDDQPKT